MPEVAQTAESQRLRREATEKYEQGKAVLDELRKPEAKGLTDAQREEKEREADARFDEAEALVKKAAREEKAAGLDRHLNAPQYRRPRAEEGVQSLDDLEEGERKELLRLQLRAFTKQLRYGGAKARELMTEHEVKAVSSLTASEGGFLAPEEVRDQLIRKLRDMSFVRSRATVIRTSRQRIGFPSFEFDGDIPTRRGDGGSVSTISITDFLGKQQFVPHERAGIFKVPEELVEDAETDIVALLTGHFAERYDEIEEQDFLTGDGIDRPLGVLSVNFSARQIAGSGSTISAEDILDLIYDLRSIHRRSPGIAFAMHRNTVRKVRKLRDQSGGAGTGQFLWQPGLQAGQPPTLAGYALQESEFFPDHNSSGSAGDPLIALGNWRSYWVVDRTQLQVLRLDERYRDEGQIGFRLRKRTDGAPVRADAFVRLNRK